MKGAVPLSLALVLMCACHLCGCHRDPPIRYGSAAAGAPRASLMDSYQLRPAPPRIPQLTFPALAIPQLAIPQLTPATLPGWWPAPLPSAANKGERAVRYAEAQRGKPYCWGGTGPACFDCSGLTSMAWRDAGRPIPRTADAQRNALPLVPMWSLRPGDVLWRPGHVGIYVGGGRALNAPGRGKPIRYQAANAFREGHRP